MTTPTARVEPKGTKTEKEKELKKEEKKQEEQQE